MTDSGNYVWLIRFCQTRPGLDMEAWKIGHSFVKQRQVIYIYLCSFDMG